VNDSTTIPDSKLCKHCNQIKPLDAFGPKKRGLYGRDAKCRECCNAHQRAYNAENRDKRKAAYANRTEEQREARRTWDRQRYQKHAEKERQESRDWRKANPEKLRAAKRRWNEANPERIRANRRAWAKANPDKVRASKRVNYINHTEKAKARARAWAKANPRNRKAHEYARRARKLASSGKITPQQLKASLAYFNHRCAACGRPAGLWHTLAGDHWIALVNGGLNTANNIVPLCHSLKDGTDGCNNTKRSRDPLEWLHTRFGPKKATAILARIQDYFEWVRAQSE